MIIEGLPLEVLDILTYPRYFGTLSPKTSFSHTAQETFVLEY
jgi:hypothetical protein